MHGWLSWVRSSDWWSWISRKKNLGTWWFFRASDYLKEVIRWVRRNKTWEISWTSRSRDGTSDWIKYRPIFLRQQR